METQSAPLRAAEKAQSFLCLIILWLVALSAITLAKTIDVNSAAFLVPALQKAQPGDTLQLAPGFYGKLALGAENTPKIEGNKLITITSKDENDPAVFSQLRFTKVNNISLIALRLDRKNQASSEAEQPALHIMDSTNIWISDSTFEGSNLSGTNNAVRDGYPAGHGILAVNSQRVAIQHNKIRNFARGIEIKDCSDLLVSDNELTQLRAYGLEVHGARDITVTGNHIHDFRRSEKETDYDNMIHFGTVNSKIKSENIKVTYNFLDAGAGPTTQSVLFANEPVAGSSAAPPETDFKKVEIVGNVIRNGHVHGISLAEGEDFWIAQNTVLHLNYLSQISQLQTPHIWFTEKTKKLRVENNIVPVLQQEFRSLRGDWKFANNYEAQRSAPAARNHYQNIFVNALPRRTLSLSDLEILPTSQFAGKNIGSPLLAFNKTPERPTGYMTSRAQLLGGLKLKLSLKLLGPKGEIPAKEVQSVSWNFGDQKSATGKSLDVDHHFSKRGTYDVVASVTLRDQQNIKITKTIDAGN
jgi:hypothetical protein